MQLLTTTWLNVFRLAGVTLAAAAVSGCSGDFSRFTSGDFFGGSTSNQRTIIGSAPSDGIVTGSVPPPGSMTTARPLPAATTSYATGGTTTAAVSHRGWTSAGGTMVTVAGNDTLASISRRYGVPEDALLATNRMTAADVRAGRQMIIPVYSTGGPAIAAAPAAGGTPATHKVVPGDTLLSIARTYNVPSKSIAEANSLANGNSIRIGQVLRIPGGTATATQVASLPTANDASPKMPAARPATVAAAAPVAAPAPTAPAAPVQPVTEMASLPALAGSAGKTATDATEEETAAAPEDQGGAGFRWPARGRVVAGFGRSASGEQNDGINIALPEGSPIKASEAGVVIYAGNELTGFGNLILVRHEGGWVTAYAHNKEMLVSRNQQVKRGEVIAYAGATGNVTQPQLHFELRKGSQPVDPLPHLSGA